MDSLALPKRGVGVGSSEFIVRDERVPRHPGKSNKYRTLKRIGNPSAGELQ
jgi:hypothetical protein